MAATSIAGDFTGYPATVRSDVNNGWPSRTSETSVLVPPTSNAKILLYPADEAMVAAPTTPAAGPERQVRTGNLAAVFTVSIPPLECMICGEVITLFRVRFFSRRTK